MLRRDFILNKTTMLLSEFLTPPAAITTRPKRKFLRQSVSAMLLSGSMNRIHVLLDRHPLIRSERSTVQAGFAPNMAGTFPERRLLSIGITPQNMFGSAAKSFLVMVQRRPSGLKSD